MAKRSRVEAGVDKPLASPFNTKPVPVSQHGALQKLILSLLFGAAGSVKRSARYLGSNTMLPGPLAAGLDKKSIRDHVKKHKYMVCEKSDGERRMLLAVPAGHPASIDGGVFFFNRSFTPECLPDPDPYMSMLAGSGPTLLDGELLLHSPAELQGELTGGKVGRVMSGQYMDLPPSAPGAAPAGATFLMFDAITVQGKGVGALNYAKRLEALGGVRLAFKKAEHEGVRAGAPPLPLLLLSKSFMGVSGVGSILRSITPVPLGGVSRHIKVYREGSRCNLNDGIVFTPVDAPYTALLSRGEGTPPLLKWKWVDDNTVDFAMYTADLEAAARAGAGVVTPVDLCLAKDRESHTKVTALPLTGALAGRYAAAAGRRAILVAECALVEGEWGVVRLRPGKSMGNHLVVGWHTMELLAENLTAPKLQAALAQSAAAAGSG